MFPYINTMGQVGL